MSSNICITTKLGDGGQSRLFSNEKVSKTDPRLEAYGDIDELVSLLGVARCYANAENQQRILGIQRDLFTVASELATTDRKSASLPQRIDATKTEELDAMTASLNASVVIPRDFIVPGGNSASAHLDCARALARRCERRVVALFENKTISNEHLMVWMNRLSDCLYLMARLENPDHTLRKP